jgi:PAS domain S-box-containing protein
MTPPAPSTSDRLVALHRYDILGTPEERAFDRITDLVARLLDAPMAGIHFVDDECQWAKAQTGVALKTLSLDVSFCAHELTELDLLVVEDASTDPRFHENPLVLGEPGIRFYAGAALKTPDGVAIGRPCVLDPEPRPDGLSDRDQATLTELAGVVMDEMEYRAQPRHREEILESITDGFVAVDSDWQVTYLNQRAAGLLNRTRDDLLGKNVWEEFPEARELDSFDHYLRVMEMGEPMQFEAYFDLFQSWFAVKVYPLETGGLSIYLDDVTEEYERREALETQRERLEMALIGGGVGMWDWDMVTNATVYDERWAGILGYTEDELEYDNSFFERHTHPDDLERVYADIERHARGELPYLDREIRMRHKDGSWRWVLDRGKIVERAADGTPLCMVGTHVDITQRKEAVEKLRESEERFDLAVQGSRDGVWDWDLASNVVWHSDRCVELLGWPREAFDDKLDSWMDILHPDDYDTVVAAIEAHQNDKVPYDIEYRCRSKEGTYRWFHARGQAIWDENDEPFRMSGTVTDITERKRQTSIEQRFGRLLRAAPSEIYVFDAETLRFVQTSRGARDNLGDSADELLALTPLDIKPFTESEFEAMLAQLRDGTKDMVVFETTHRRKDGSTYPVQLRLQLNREETPPSFIAIVLDITLRQRREHELIEAKERAEEMNRLKSTILANMSHEIRTPLTAIIGFADVLKTKLRGENAELLSMIFQSGQRLERTLTSVLDLAQLESKAIELKAEDIDLRAEVEEAISLFQQEARGKNIELNASIPPGPVHVTLDGGAVQRILANLISNAVKFTNEGSVCVRLARSDSGGVIEVEDTGIGIGPESRERIFREFTQASEGYRRSYEGVGLGLHITRRLVDLLGGHITLSSEEGVGSTFTVRSPQVFHETENAP